MGIKKQIISLIHLRKIDKIKILGFSELVYNEQIFDQIGHFSTQVNLVVTKKFGRTRAVRYNLGYDRIWL